jgi:hypothetical protein
MVSNGWSPDERTLQHLVAAHAMPGAVLSLRCDATELHRHRKRAAIRAGVLAAGATTGRRDAAAADLEFAGAEQEPMNDDDLEATAPAESAESSDEAAAAAAAAEEQEQAAIAAAEADAAEAASFAASLQELGVASAGDALQWSGLQNTARLAVKLWQRVEAFVLPEPPLEAQQVVAPQSAVATAMPLGVSGGSREPASTGGQGGHAVPAGATSAPEAYGRPTLTPARVVPLSLGLSLVALGACRLSKFAGVCPVALLEGRQQAAADAASFAGCDASEGLDESRGHSQASRHPAVPLTLTAAGPIPQAFSYAHAEVREGTAAGGGEEEEGEGSSPAEGDDDGAGSVGEEAFPQAEVEDDGRAGDAAAAGRTTSAGGGLDGSGARAAPALECFGQADYTPPVVAVQLGACLYLLSSQRAALAFARAPLRYVTQPPPEQAVPLCLAVVGPPGCGVGDLAAEAAASAGLLHISPALAIAYVCERVGAYVALSARVRSLLSEGGCLPEDVVLQCIAATALSAEATSRGCVIDGWPRSAAEAAALAACGVLPSRVVWVGCPSDVTLSAVQAAGQRLALAQATSPQRAASTVLAPSLPAADGEGRIDAGGWFGGDNGEADDEADAAGEQTGDESGPAAAVGLPRWTAAAELQGYANVSARAWRMAMGDSGKRAGQLGTAVAMPAPAATITATEVTPLLATLAAFRASETQLIGWYRDRFANVLCVDATPEYSGGQIRCGVSARQTRQLVAGLAVVQAEASYAASAMAAGWAAPLAASLPALGTLHPPHGVESSALDSAITAALRRLLQGSSPFGAACPVTWVLQRESVSPLSAAGTGILSLAARSVTFRGRAYATAGSLETRELCARPARYLQGLAPPGASVRADRMSLVAALMQIPSRLSGPASAAGSATDPVAARGLCAVCIRTARTQLAPTQLQTALAVRAGLRHLAARVFSGAQTHRSTPGGLVEETCVRVWRCCCEEHLTALLRMPGYYTVGLQAHLPLRPPLKLGSVLLQPGAPLTAGAALLRQLPAGSAAAQEGADFTAGLLSQLHGAAAASADFRAYMQASVFPPLSAGLAALERCRGLLYHPQAASIRASALNFLSLWLQAHDPYARPHLRARSRKALAAFLGECGLEVSDVVVVTTGPGEACAAGSPSPGLANSHALLSSGHVGERVASGAASGLGRGQHLDPLQQAPVLIAASARARSGIGDGEGFVESAGHASIAASTTSPARKQLPPVGATPGAR